MFCIDLKIGFSPPSQGNWSQDLRLRSKSAIYSNATFGELRYKHTGLIIRPCEISCVRLCHASVTEMNVLLLAIQFILKNNLLQCISILYSSSANSDTASLNKYIKYNLYVVFNSEWQQARQPNPSR
jgi:hypothetical protein